VEVISRVKERDVMHVRPTSTRWSEVLTARLYGSGSDQSPPSPPPPVIPIVVPSERVLHVGGAKVLKARSPIRNKSPPPRSAQPRKSPEIKPLHVPVLHQPLMSSIHTYHAPPLPSPSAGGFHDAVVLMNHRKQEYVIRRSELLDPTAVDASAIGYPSPTRRRKDTVTNTTTTMTRHIPSQGQPSARENLISF
jgi:hypothetical protein